MKKTKQKPFYHRYVQVDQIYVHIQKMKLKPEEEKKAWDLVEEIIHARFIDAVLDKLPAHKHETFLEKFAQKGEDKELLDFLETEIKEIHTHLQQTWVDLEKEITQDILESF